MYHKWFTCDWDDKLALADVLSPPNMIQYQYDNIFSDTKSTDIGIFFLIIAENGIIFKDLICIYKNVN